MLSDRPANVAVFATLFLFLVLTFIGFIRRYTILCGHVKSGIGYIVESYLTWKNGEHLDEVQTVVQEKVQARKVEHFLWACHILSGLLVPGSILLLFDIGAGGDNVFSLVQSIAYLFLQVPLTLFTLFPCVLTWRTIDAFYIFYVGCASLYASPWAMQPNDVVLTMLFCVNAPLALLNIARRSLFVNVSMNFVFAVSSCSTILVHGDAVTSMPIFTCIVQCMSLIIFPVCACKVDTSIIKAIRHGLECDAAREALAAACAMLRSCCDVVVELDATGTILSPAIDLGSFLLRGPNCNLQNTKLVDLVSHETDKELFVNKLAAPRASDMALAEATHVRMRDGNDNTIRVELLWFRFLHLDEVHYMLGLREFSDVISAKPANRYEHRERGDSESGSQQSNSLTDGQRSSCSQSSSRDSFYEPPAVLGVDSSCAGLHLRECTIGFSHRVGRLPLGTCLIELVHRKREFKNWVEDAVNAALNNEDTEPMAVTLQMRTGQVQANCKVLRPILNADREPTQDEEQLSMQSHFDPEHVRLHFYDIKQSFGHKRVRHGNRNEGQDMTWPTATKKGTPVSRLSL